VLIPVQVLKKYWGVNPQSIVHVGAHNAEELETYEKAGWGPVTWIEAQPQKIQELAKRIPSHHRLIEAAIWDKEGMSLNLNVMTSTQSTSLLNLGTHATEHPTIQFSHSIPVKTKTLASILDGSSAPELLALDIQGVELRALTGYGEKIADVKWIYCEVNKAELYEDCCLVYDIDSYLSRFYFRRAATRWTSHGWGDALYENTNLIKKRGATKRILTLVPVITWRTKPLLARVKQFFKVF
jgi:FkbM family methyltransferase